MRILIADDEPVSRLTLQAALVRLGYDVTVAVDGAGAMQVLLTPDAPRLAILDWMMPGVDGLAVCRELRARPGPYIYLVLLTARAGRADMVKGLDAGADDFLTKPLDVIELKARLRSGERIIALQEDLLRTQDQLEHQASHDRLTGLWNRVRILDQLARELSRSQREKAALSVVLADIDHFKKINDSDGHAAGDAVLTEVACRMQSTLRISDVIGRYGGEEFLLVLPRAELAGGHDVAERVRAAVEARSIAGGGAQQHVTLSLGVACTTGAGFEAATLLHAADAALYRAKARGRNCVEAA